MLNEDWLRLMSALQDLGLVRIKIDKKNGFIGGYLPPSRD